MTRTVARLICSIFLVIIECVSLSAQQPIKIDLKSILSSERGITGVIYEYKNKIFYVSHKAEYSEKGLRSITVPQRRMEDLDQYVGNIFSIAGRSGNNLFISMRFYEFSKELHREIISKEASINKLIFT